MTGGIETAKVDWAANAPRSIFFDDIYYSPDAAAESRHVFIAGNDLERRFCGRLDFAIGELGFGTGLNMLVAADLWRRTPKPRAARLHLVSFEKHPLTRGDLARALSAFPDHAALAEALMRAYPPPVDGLHRIRLADDVALTLALGEAAAMLPRLEATIDAWFLDGFAPSRNPDLWSPAIFAGMARLSAPGATAATFTVAGEVRRALTAAGFTVEKRAGYGRKKEMLAARLVEKPPAAARRAPWFAREPMKRAAPGARIAIIGGGVAGASLARELLRGGLHPVIIDPKGIGAGASGNPAGLIMPRLDLGEGPAARFFRAAFLYACATIAELERESGEKILNPCGVFVALDDPFRRARLLETGIWPTGWIEARPGGVFLPRAGVIDPPLYCALLARGADLIARRAMAIEDEGDAVVVRFDDGARGTFDQVVIAAAAGSSRFREARTLPLSTVMGQVDEFPGSPAPACAMTAGCYAAPSPQGGLIIGATYERADDAQAAATSAAATIENIRAACDLIPDIAGTLDAASSLPRAAMRCQTPDRLPIAGRAPDMDHYAAFYDGLRHGRRCDYPIGRAVERRFLLTGLGSRGLVAAPLAAAMIAADMTGAPSPVEREIAEALHPARFFVRDLKRGRMKAASPFLGGATGCGAAGALAGGAREG